MHAEYDGYCDFFTLCAADVEYVDVGNGVVVKELRLDMFSALAARRARWSDRIHEYSGPALLFRRADALDEHLIVANTLVFIAGVDWPF